MTSDAALEGVKELLVCYSGSPGLYEAETLSNGQEAVVFFFWSKINIIKFIK